MGGSKTTTTTNNATTASTQLPQWMTSAGQDLYNKAAATPVVGAYDGQMAAGSSANQQAASAAAAGNAGNWQGDLNKASALTMASATAPAASVSAGQFTPEAAAQYANPYQQQVQQNTLNQMTTQNAIDHQALNDSVAGAKAYGGTRQAVLEGQQAKDQALAKQNYIDTSNAAGYDAARTQFNADADRSLQGQTTNAGLWEQMLGRIGAGGAQMGQIADSKSSLGARDVATLSATGAADQATQQNQLSSAYNEYLRAGNAPLENYKDLMAILSGTPRNVTTTGTSNGTSTQQQSGSFLNSMLGLGQLGLSAYSTFSDPRLKKDVGLIERLKSGLGIYRFRYLWEMSSEPEHIGVMADEVARIVPEALGPVIAGFMTVDYDKLAEAM